MGNVWKIKTSQYTLILSQIAVIVDNGDEGLVVHMTGNTLPVIVEPDVPGYGTLIAWSELDDKIRVGNKTLALCHINDVWQNKGVVGVHMAGNAPMQAFEPDTPSLDKLIAWSEQDQWNPWIIE
jgi:hypothetical protein